MTFELERVEFGVQGTVLQKLFVGALADDFAISHDNNPVCGEYGGEAMSDDNAGSPLHEVVQSLLDDALGFSVQSRSGFVQDQKRRVLHDGPGNGQTLFLSP